MQGYLLYISGSRYTTRNTILEHPSASAQDRSQRSRQRYRLGYSRNTGTPFDITRESAGRVTPVAHSKRSRSKSTQGCGFAGVLLWAQTVIGSIECDFTYVGHPSTAASSTTTNSSTVLRESTPTATSATAVDGHTTAAGTPSAFLSSKSAAYSCRISTTHRQTVPLDGQQRVGHHRGRASTATHGICGC